MVESVKTHPAACMPGTTWTLVRDQHKPTGPAPTGGVSRTVTGKGGGRGAGLPGGTGPGPHRHWGEGFKLRKPLGQPLRPVWPHHL